MYWIAANENASSFSLVCWKPSRVQHAFLVVSELKQLMEKSAEHLDL